MKFVYHQLNYLTALNRESFVQCAQLSTERSFALALSFCTTTNSVVLSQLRSAQDSNTCVLRFNEKYSVNFRFFFEFYFLTVLFGIWKVILKECQCFSYKLQIICVKFEKCTFSSWIKVRKF